MGNSKEQKRNVYVGHRYVPKIMDEWEKTNSYEGLSIVTYQGNSYTSKKHVPVGIDILNKEYWVVTGNYNAQVEQYRKDVRDMEERVGGDLDLFGNDLNIVKSDMVKNTNNINSREINILYPPAPLLAAKGDRVTDDTAAILGCLNYLKAKGGELKLPAGYVFRYTSPIVVDQGVHIDGGGFRESYTGNTSNRPTVLLKDGNFLGVDVLTAGSISNLCLDGAPDNGGDGLRLNGNSARGENVIVSGMGGDGVHVGDPLTPGNRNSWIMTNVKTISNKGYGFVINTFDDGGGPNANGGVALKCNAWNNGKDGWKLGDCAVNTFIGCYSESNKGFGWFVGVKSKRNTFITAQSEQNVLGDFIFEEGSSNNLLIKNNPMKVIDNGRNTVMGNDGGSNQFFNINRNIVSGENSLINNGLTAGFHAHSSLPGVALHETVAKLNEKSWDMIASQGNLKLRILDDNGKEPMVVSQVNREGKTISSFEFNSKVIAKNGIGVGNAVTVNKPTPATVWRKVELFSSDGNSLGYFPVYQDI